MVKRSNNRRTKRSPLVSIHQVFYKHPLFLWGGLWVSLLLISSMAALGLMNPGYIVQKRTEAISPGSTQQEQAEAISPGSTQQEQAEAISPSSTQQEQAEAISPSSTQQEQPEPTPASKINQKSLDQRSGFTRVPEKSDDNSVPLWLYGAIALSCSLGLILIFLSFTYRPRPRKPIKRVGKNFQPTAAKTSKNRVPKQRKRLVKKRRLVPSKQRRQPQVPTPVFVVDPVVTVLSPEESHPLDWGDQGLAEIMDLRKRQSLTSLLSDRD
jgi:hypothetical protein